MESSAEMVDEVVVVAYGVRKKGTTTGSMSVVKDKIMETVPTPSFDQALQGQASGLQVLSNSGEPGAVANLNSRYQLYQCRYRTFVYFGRSSCFIGGLFCYQPQ